MKRAGWIFAVFLVLTASLASAEENFGVPVYPGAKYDETTSKALKESMGFNGACYRTTDPIAKVAEFYRKLGLESIGEVTKEGALFTKGKINVTMQSPWMNMKTGAMMKDTLISIVQNEF